MNDADRSSFALSFGAPNAQQSAIARAQLDHDCFAQTRMRVAVEKHDPAILRRAFSPARAGHVHDLVVLHPARSGEGERALAGLDREDAACRTGRVFEAAQRDEQDRADREPCRIDPRKEAPEHAAIIRGVTRGEIAEKLITIVRQEKNVSEELLAPETPLAEAGIDSLDSLTILFAIEEQFRISIPDDRARAIRTFGDMIDVVEDLTARA